MVLPHPHPIGWMKFNILSYLCLLLSTQRTGWVKLQWDNWTCIKNWENRSREVMWLTEDTQETSGRGNSGLPTFFSKVSISFPVKRMTVNQGLEVCLWAKLDSCFSLSVLPEINIKHFVFPTPVPPRIHSDYIKHLESQGNSKSWSIWNTVVESCKEVLRARTEPSGKNLAQLQGVPFSRTTWECATELCSEAVLSRACLIVILYLP